MESDFAQLKMLSMKIFCVCVVIDGKTLLLCHGFPVAVDVADESDKCGRSVCLAKRHDSEGVLDSAEALKGKLFLTG
jgi:hypothetical protein